MVLLRSFLLAALAALLGLGSSTGSLSEGAFAQVQECTVTVQPGESIQEAIEAAEGGAVICLGEGTWEENLVIEKSLTLRGSGEEQTILASAQESMPILQVQGGEEVRVHLEDLSLARSLIQSSFISCVIVRMDERVQVNCPVGLVVQGRAAVTFQRGRLFENDNGIMTFGEPRVALRDVDVFRNDGGLVLEGSTHLTLQRSSLSSNGVGLKAKDSVEVLIENTSLSESDTGLSVQGSAHIRLVEVALSQNEQFGLRVPSEDRSTIEVQNSSIEGNGRCGVGVFSRQTRISGSSNVMRDNGIDLCGFAPASLRQPLVPPSGRTELAVPEDYPSLQEAIDALAPGGTITLAPGTYPEAGVLIWKPLTLKGAGSEQTILQNPESASKPVVLSLLAEARRVTIEDLWVEGASTPGQLTDGLWVEGEEITLRNIVVTNHSGNGFQVGGEESSVKLTLIGAEVSANTIGMAVRGTAQADFIDSRIAGNLTGLAINSFGRGGAAQVSLENTRIVNNEYYGLQVGGSAQVRLSNSSLSQNGEDFLGSRLDAVGLLVTQSSRVELIASSVSSNVGDGIRLRDSATVEIRDSAILDNKGCGIFVLSHRAQLRGTPNEMRANGVDLCGFAPAAVRRPLVPETGRTELSVPGDFPSLQEAVDALAPGGTIHLAAGTYEGATLWKPLTLKGAGPEQTILQARPRSWVAVSVLPDAREVTLQELSVTGAGTTERGLIFLVGGRGAGLLLYGSAATLRDVRVFGNEGRGLWLVNAPRVELQHLEAFDNGEHGLFLQGAPWGTIDAGSLELMFVPTVATLRESSLSHNGQGGLALRGLGQVRLYHTHMEDNTSCGLTMNGEWWVMGWGNRFSGNALGEACQDPSAPIRVEPVDLDRLRRTPPPQPHSRPQVRVPQDVPTLQEAIDLVADGGTILVAPGTYEETLEALNVGFVLRREGEGPVRLTSEDQLAGILIFADAPKEVRLEGVTVGPSFRYGLVVGGSADAALSDVEISGNGIGLFAQDESTVDLVGSRLLENKSLGLLICSDRRFLFKLEGTECSAGATLADTTISGNGGGLKVNDSAQASLTRTTISDSNLIGLSVCCRARVTLVNSEISGSQLTGLLVWGQAEATLIDSQVSDNGQLPVLREGISASGSARVRLQGTEVSHHKGHGLRIGGSAQVEVVQSVITDNGLREECRTRWICNGIAIEDQAYLLVEGSTIRGNADWGLAALQEQCGYGSNDFEGSVSFEGENVIEGNNTSGNQDGMGNPGEHPWNRPDVPDGQVCLP